jgi:hypothetical protein
LCELALYWDKERVLEWIAAFEIVEIARGFGIGGRRNLWKWRE